MVGPSSGAAWPRSWDHLYAKHVLGPFTIIDRINSMPPNGLSGLLCKPSTPYYIQLFLKTVIGNYWWKLFSGILNEFCLQLFLSSDNQDNPMESFHWLHDFTGCRCHSTFAFILSSPVAKKKENSLHRGRVRWALGKVWRLGTAQNESVILESPAPAQPHVLGLAAV